MSALVDHLDHLAAWLRREDRAPAWRSVRLIEARDITWGPMSTIPRSAMHSISDYEARFDSLLAKGFAWLNFSALGVLDEELIVCVELPSDSIGAYGRTSVNLSGPPLDPAGGLVWDASQRHRIV